MSGTDTTGCSVASIVPFPPTTGRPMPKERHAQSLSEPVGARDDSGQWERWMREAQRGDRAAYHALLTAVTPYLRALVRRYFGSPHDAEDAVQEILIALNDIRHTYEPGRPFKPWLATVAHRRCIDLLRRRAHRGRNEIAIGDDDFPEIAGEEGPEHAFARQDLRRTLDASVAELPARQREAVRLLHLRELSLRDAATESRQSVGALKVACHRALKALERKLSNLE